MNRWRERKKENLQFKEQNVTIWKTEELYAFCLYNKNKRVCLLYLGK